MSSIQGMGEFDSIRRTVQKDDMARKKSEREESRTPRTAGKDSAQVSDAARMYKMRDNAVDKLENVPDPREEKIQEILEKIDSGSLLTPANVKNSIARMINRGLI